MTTIDDLRRALDERALDASDGAGMAERVHAGAVRTRRRRRIGVVAAAACLAVAAAIVVPAAVVRLRADGLSPATVTQYRGPGQLTVRPAADTTYLWARGTDGALQWMSPYLAGKNGDTCCIGTVRVYDPGKYDSAALEKGEKITVGGHPAFWATTRLAAPSAPMANPPADLDTATVGWRDSSGAWVTVIDEDAGTGPPPVRLTPAETRAHLLDIAEDVRLGAPQDVLVPMHFPAIPDDLPITFTDVDERTHTNATQTAALGFGGPDAPSVGLRAEYVQINAPLSITAWTANGSAPWFEVVYGPVNTTVAGHPARYYEKRESQATVPAGGSKMLVEIGSCGIEIIVQDRNAITRADLEAMFVGATFDECDSTKTWTRPLN